MACNFNKSYGRFFCVKILCKFIDILDLGIFVAQSGSFLKLKQKPGALKSPFGVLYIFTILFLN